MPPGAAKLVSRALCPACLRASATEIYRLAYSDERLQDYLRRFYEPQGDPDPKVLREHDFVLDACSACTLVYQRNVPNADFARELYERWIDPSRAMHLDRKQRGGGFFTGLAREIVSVERHLGQRPKPLRAHDFGMGWGEWCLMARAFGMDVSGSELSDARRGHARSLGIPVADLESLPDGGFDIINTEQVLEHLAEPVRVLRRLARALSPLGLLKISVPDGRHVRTLLASPDWSIPKGSPGSLNVVAPLEHLNCFSHRSMLALANSAGLQPVALTLTAQYGARITLTSSRKSLAKLWLAPAVRRVWPHRGTYCWFTRALATLDLPASVDTGWLGDLGRW